MNPKIKFELYPNGYSSNLTGMIENNSFTEI